MQRTVRAPVCFTLSILAALLLSAMAVLALPGRALADCSSTVTVINTDDSDVGSLRYAISAVCAGGSIDFDPSLTSSGPATITLTSGELLIDKDMTITGPDANLLAVSGGSTSRVFNVNSGINATINKLTIADGSAGNEDYGGGILSNGVLTVTGSALVNNGAAAGAGIAANGPLTVTGSTFSGNNALVDAGSIYVYHSTLVVVNSTFYNNSAANGGGGGIYAFFSSGTVTNSTFANNSALWGSAVYVENGTVTFANTVMAQQNNGSGACGATGEGPLIDSGGNIDAGDTCEFSAANGSFPNTDPLLAPFQTLDGVNLLPLLPGSPAIDIGMLKDCPFYDQRRAYRPQGGDCDSGAFETQGFTLSVTGGSPQTTTVFSAFAEPLTVTVSSYDNDPVGPGGVVKFTPPSEGPGLNVTTPFTAATDVDGNAVSGVITANNITGSYGVTATVRGEDVIFTACGGKPCGGAPTVFDLTNERIAPDINLDASPNPSAFGEAVSVSVSVTTSVPGAGMPTGVITFTVDDGFMGADTLNANGGATLSVDGLAVGSHSIQVEYAGDDAYTGGQANTVTQVVNKAPTITRLQIMPVQAFYGQRVDFGVSVKPDRTGPMTLRSVASPSGLVTITDATGLINLQGWLLDGKTIFSGGVIPAGTYSVTATYEGDDNYEGSTSQGVALVIERYPTNTALNSSSNPVFVGDPLYFTAAVSEMQLDVVREKGFVAPTGAVVITDTTGAINLGGSLADGTIQLLAPPLPAGMYTVTATYLGDERLAPSVSTQLIQVVERQPTSTELMVLPNPALVGQTIRLAAAVSAVNPTALISGGPSGTVEFRAGLALLGSAVLSGGEAYLSVPATYAGDFVITARYLGNDRYTDSSSAEQTLVVAKYDTATALTAAPNPSRLGGPVNLTATVTGASERYAPTGAITFVADGVAMGTVSLNQNGSAFFTTSSLAAGSHTITAQYGGDTIFIGSTSAEYQQVVKITPLAVNDAAGAQDQPVSINVTANDLDPAGGGLTIISVTAPDHGSATIEPNSQNVIYTPQAGYSGIDIFEYAVRDSQGNVDAAMVVVVVTTPASGQETPQVQATNPTTDSTAAFTGTSFGVNVLAPAGFFTDTLDPKDVLFISFTPVLTPTEETNNPPANLKFGNAEFALEVFLNNQLLTGQTFAVPLVVTINYDPAVLRSLKPETLGLWYWDGTAWNTDGVTIISNDVANHTLTVSMTHFSLYAFFAAAPTGLNPDDEPEAPFRLYLPNVNK